MFLHQIFLSIDGSDLSSFPRYIENSEKLKYMNPLYDYKLWDDAAIYELLNTCSDNEREIVESFPHKFYLVDFAKYIILRNFGGLYIDMDEHPLQSLPPPELLPSNIIGTCCFKGDKIIKNPEKFTVCNNIIRLEPSLAASLVDYAETQMRRISKMQIYQIWRGRALKQSVGVEMFKRFCRHRGLKSELDTYIFFFNQNTRAWECLVSDKKLHFKRAHFEASLGPLSVDYNN